MENKLWSNIELRSLEKELDGFKLDTPCSSSGLTEKYCGVLGEHSWYISKDVCKDTGLGGEWIITDIKSFQILRDKLIQLRKLQMKTEYAKKMASEDLTNMINDGLLV